MTAKRAFITGITGQDGSYLAELLLQKDYEVHGLVHRAEAVQIPYLKPLLDESRRQSPRVRFHIGEMEDAESLRRALAESKPDEVYHLAGQTHVGSSFEAAELTCRVTALGTLRLLNLVRDLAGTARFFNASSSEVFGSPAQSPQDELTPIAPVTPYGCAKAFATHMGRLYRKTFGLFLVNGILFNHESPRRGEQFVTRKICRAAAGIKMGRQHELVLGNTAGQRDWGHAQDYVRGMWMSLQHSEPEDFVFATGRLHSVQEIIEIAFGVLQLDWRSYTKSDPQFLRAEEPQRLLGNPEKANRVLGWKAETSFEEIIKQMTEAELAALRS